MNRKFKKPKKKNAIKIIKRLSLFAIAGVLVVFLVFLVVTNFKTNERREEFKLKVEELKSKIEEFEKQKELLESRISQADNPDYLEEIAREELNFKKQGEKVAALYIPQEEEEKEIQEKQSFWQKIWEKVKGEDNLE